MADGVITRTIDEITASAKMNMQDMTNRAIALGHDLIDAKGLLGHGNFLSWLMNIGISKSTASNFMRVAREVKPGTQLAGIQYSKVLAILHAPPEEREMLAAESEGKSAAEIRRLIAERDKAAEACNAETVRADKAEKDAKRFYDENAGLNNKVSVLQNEINKQKQYIESLREEIDKQTQDEKDQENWEQAREIAILKEQLDKAKADLLTAENNRIEVEVLPKDFREQQDQLIEAAAAAEERAAAAEEELENLRNQHANGGSSDFDKLHYNTKLFMLNCELLAVDVSGLLPDRDRAIRDIDRIAHWCAVARDALASALIGAEGAVVE